MAIISRNTDWLSHDTDIKINQLSDYLMTLTKQLKLMAEDYDKNIDPQAQKISDETERNDFYEWNHWNYTEDFPRILLNAFHVTAYTLLESEIYLVARNVGKKQNQVFDVSDFGNRDYLKNASFYIAKLTKVDLSKFASWNKLNDGRILRNNIVHSNAILTKEGPAIDVAKRLGLLDTSRIQFPSVRPIAQLTISHEYSTGFLGTLQDFFRALYKEMKAGNYL